MENNDETLAIFDKIKAKLFVRKKRHDEAQKLEKLFFTSVFLPGESHGQRSLVGYSP